MYVCSRKVKLGHVLFCFITETNDVFHVITKRRGFVLRVRCEKSTSSYRFPTLIEMLFAGRPPVPDSTQKRDTSLQKEATAQLQPQAGHVASVCPFSFIPFVCVAAQGWSRYTDQPITMLQSLYAGLSDEHLDGTFFFLFIINRVSA